jgi:hypothetical protein
MKKLRAADSADAIVDGLRRRRAKFYVPSSLRPPSVLDLALPRRIKRIVHRAFRSDQIAQKLCAVARSSFVYRVEPAPQDAEPATAYICLKSWCPRFESGSRRCENPDAIGVFFLPGVTSGCDSLGHGLGHGPRGVLEFEGQKPR